MQHYRTVVADPPWDFKWGGSPGGRRRNATQLGYGTLSLAEIAHLFHPAWPIGWERQPWSDDATLLLWVTQDALHAGHGQIVANAWGFRHRVGEFIWRKRNFGAGDFPRIGHETCLIYRRGQGSLRPDRPKNVHSVQTWAQDYSNNGGKKHSAKPDGFFDLVEQGFCGPYLELFARRARMDWDYWGDESLQTVEMPAA